MSFGTEIAIEPAEDALVVAIGQAQLREALRRAMLEQRAHGHARPRRPPSPRSRSCKSTSTIKAMHSPGRGLERPATLLRNRVVVPARLVDARHLRVDDELPVERLDEEARELHAMPS